MSARHGSRPRVAVVTGAASGIGAETAALFRMQFEIGCQASFRSRRRDNLFGFETGSADDLRDEVTVRRRLLQD